MFSFWISFILINIFTVHSMFFGFFCHLSSFTLFKVYLQYISRSCLDIMVFLSFGNPLVKVCNSSSCFSIWFLIQAYSFTWNNCTFLGLVLQLMFCSLLLHATHLCFLDLDFDGVTMLVFVHILRTLSKRNLLIT